MDYKKGNIVIGTVTGIEKYGIFVKIDDANNGLIHISEISDAFVRNPADYVTVGEKIKTVIIEDKSPESNHIKLSIKKLDYQICHKKTKKIAETKHGFSTLKEKLPRWISLKEEEIKIKNRKMKKK